MEIILNEEALVKVLDEITMEKLKEAEDIKNDYETKKLEMDLEKKKKEIDDSIHECWAFQYYIKELAGSEKENKTAVYFIQEYKYDHYEILFEYIKLTRQYGFELVDDVIQERIDYNIQLLNDEEE